LVKIQMDEPYLGGERPGGMAGFGSESKVPIDAAVPLNEAGHPISLQDHSRERLQLRSDDSLGETLSRVRHP